jgi:putative cardiolipin synthase
MKHLATLELLHRACVAMPRWVACAGIAAWSARAVLMALIAALSGCASLPQPAARAETRALAVAPAAPLAQAAEAALAANAASASAFRLLPAGDQALDARIALARRAQRSLDLQYYHLAHDATGLQLLRELRDAAARGVRVRLLVDDLYAVEQDALLASLAARPNMEVRMFNPLPVRDGTMAQRVLLSLNELSRINRRMHNRLFVADNSLAVTGGRNIADEYFDRSEPANFIDMDVLAAGAVVQQLSQVFDRYWNSRHAWPIERLAGSRLDAGSADALIDATAPLQPVDGIDALGQTAVSAQLAHGRLELFGADAAVLADDPAKIDQADEDATEGQVARGHLAMLDEARSDILISSPYVVPGKAQLAALDNARQRSVKVSVMTNSLSTTDEPLVHTGYARHRDALLKMGVSLYELMPLAVKSAAASATGSMGRLHAKLSVVDGQRVFIGSMNLDRRSARCNTEMGLVIDSGALAGQLTRLLQRDRLPASYRLRLAASGIEWVAGADNTEVVHVTEPDAGWAQALRLWFTAQFVSEEML